MQKKVVLKITGRVQGVLYRTNAKKEALSLNLVGFVQNKTGGTVEIIAEGEENNLKKLIDWCYSGPPSASVENIKEDWENYTGGFNSFEIKY